MATQQQPKGNNPWDEKEVGAIWKKKSKTKGEAYLSIVVNVKKLLAAGFSEEAQLISFVNKNKQKDSHPDLRIFVSERRDPSKTGGAPAAPTVAAKTTRATVTTPAEVQQAPDDNELI